MSLEVLYTHTPKHNNTGYKTVFYFNNSIQSYQNTLLPSGIEQFEQHSEDTWIHDPNTYNVKDYAEEHNFSNGNLNSYPSHQTGYHIFLTKNGTIEFKEHNLKMINKWNNYAKLEQSGLTNKDIIYNYEVRIYQVEFKDIVIYGSKYTYDSVVARSIKYKIYS